jgi:autotransporter-associated beta strand protein
MLRAVRMAAPKLMLSLAVIAGVSAGNVRRAQAQSADIPLQLISFGTGSSQTYSLGINIGIGSSAPKPYLFDTGSAPFNAAYSAKWWPSSITPTNPAPLATDVSYSYATGTTLTGNIVAVPSISFYASSMATTPSYTLPTLTPGYQVTAITSSTILDFSNLIQNNQPFIRGTFFGVFGAGDFVNIINASGSGMATLGSVLGQSTIPGTTAGYVVAANGQRISTMNGPQGTQTVTNCSPCVILGLTPSVLAQFTTIVPWSGKSSVSFPNSGAPSSIQFGNTFNLSLSGAQIPTVSWSGPTLLDTGTANTILHGPPGISAYQSNQPCGNPPGACANNGTTLSVAGAVPGGAVSSQTTLDPVTNGSTYTVTLKTPLGIQVVGIPFFLQNSVLFDLNGQAVGYTSNFVTDTPIVTPLTVTSSTVPLGLAGVISGTGGVSITAGGSATLTAANTYTGPTIVSAGYWLSVLTAGGGSRCRLLSPWDGARDRVAM